MAASPAFNTTFSDQSPAIGPYAEDTIGIGNVNISNVQFGLVQQSPSFSNLTKTGTMGVGYSSLEASANRYPNIPEVLVASGTINSRLYSVYLNDAIE